MCKCRAHEIGGTLATTTYVPKLGRRADTETRRQGVKTKGGKETGSKKQGAWSRERKAEKETGDKESGARSMEQGARGKQEWWSIGVAE